ncbi:MAG: hypothetical protein AAF593_00770 [Planctomycetota bacterium]
MSAINFAKMRELVPGYQDAMGALESWATSHPSVREFEAARIGDQERDLPSWRVAAMFSALVDQGLVRPVVAIEDEHGMLQATPYATHSELEQAINKSEFSLPSERTKIGYIYRWCGDERG